MSRLPVGKLYAVACLKEVDAQILEVRELGWEPIDFVRKREIFA
jgi:hypothetical protein